MMKVDVYWNSRKKCWSVRAAEGEQKGRVIDHRDTLTLKDCKFVVQEGGRQRVLREKKKNVHAWVRGEYYPDGYYLISIGAVPDPIGYNPYKVSSFVYHKTNERVDEAFFAFFCKNDSEQPILTAF